VEETQSPRTGGLPVSEMSDAADYLEGRQDADPPWRRPGKDAPLDRIKALYELLEPNLPSWATTGFQTGSLVIGEIGLQSPEAFTQPFSDGSHAIVITSGYLHLFQTVARDVSAALDLSPEGKNLVPLLSHGDAIQRIAAWLQQYLNGDIFHGYSLGEYDLALSPAQDQLANTISRMAALFTFAHELGHVGVDVNHTRRQTSSDEQDADVVGFTLLLASSKRLDLGMAYAGALFAVRLHACLEKAGFKFKDARVSLTDRVNFLKGGIKTDIAKNLMRPGDLTWAWAEAVFQLLFEPVAGLLSYSDQLHRVSAQPISESPNQGSARSVNATERKKAAVRLRELKRDFPPWEWTTDGRPLDRTVWLRKTLTRALPHLRPYISDSRQFFIGEVGLPEPQVTVHDFEDGSLAIVLNSGLIHLVTAVSRFLHTRIVVRSASGESAGSLVSNSDAVDLISELFREVGRGTADRTFLEFALPGFSRLQEDRGSLQPLTREQMILADELALGAVSFIMLSSFYDATSKRYKPLDRSVVKQLVPGLSYEEFEERRQFDPDGLGERAAAFHFSGAVPWLGFRQTFAASLFAIRVLNCIKMATESSFQPDPERMNRITMAPWRQCGSEMAVRYMTNVGTFYDSIMKAVEISISGAPIFPSTNGPALAIELELEESLWASQCIAWWIAGGIGQVVRGEENAQSVLDCTKELTSNLTEIALRAFANSLIDNPTIKGRLDLDLPDHQRAQRRREVVDWIIARLPERERRVLVEVREAPWTGPSLGVLKPS
jgi:hypothetical protein